MKSTTSRKKMVIKCGESSGSLFIQQPQPYLFIHYPVYADSCLDALKWFVNLRDKWFLFKCKNDTFVLR